MTAPHARWVANVSEYPAREPAAVHRPSTVSDVAGLVAGRPAGSPRLRTVSTGRNWGLGSAATGDEDVCVADLSGLTGIRHIDTELGFAVIEAGVTQAILSEALAETPWYLNCTASSAHTSVLGNIMDRGVGIRHQRTEDLLGLEVVLGDGEVSSIGWWPGKRGKAPNRYGVGPSMLQVFTQANFAIATAAVVQLQPRPEHRAILTFTVDESRYADLLLELRDLVRQQFVSGVVKVYDPVSTDLYGGSKAQVTSHLAVEGTRAVVAAKRAEIESRLGELGATFAERASVEADSLAHAVTNLYGGDVSRSEDIVRAALSAPTKRADAEGTGWIFSLPFVPFTVHDVTQARKIVLDVADQHGLSIGTTVNVLSHNVIDLVVAISFDRRTQSERAHRALEALTDRFVDAGYHPYRLDISRNRSDTVTADAEAALLADLHRVIDPHGVFAPSRYTR